MRSRWEMTSGGDKNIAEDILEREVGSGQNFLGTHTHLGVRHGGRSLNVTPTTGRRGGKELCVKLLDAAVYEAQGSKYRQQRTNAFRCIERIRNTIGATR